MNTVSLVLYELSSYMIILNFGIIINRIIKRSNHKFSFLVIPLSGIMVVNVIFHYAFLLKSNEFMVNFKVTLFIISTLVVLYNLKLIKFVFYNATAYLLYFALRGQAINYFDTFDSYKILLHAQVIINGDFSNFSVNELLSWGTASPVLTAYHLLNNDYLFDPTFNLFVNLTGISAVIFVFMKLSEDYQFKNSNLIKIILIMIIGMIITLNPWSKLMFFYISDHFIFTCNLLLFSYYSYIILRKGEKQSSNYILLIFSGFLGFTLRSESWPFFALITSTVLINSYIEKKIKRYLVILIFANLYGFFPIMNFLKNFGNVTDIGELYKNNLTMNLWIQLQFVYVIIVLIVIFIKRRFLTTKVIKLFQLKTIERLLLSSFLVFLLFNIAVFGVNNLVTTFNSILFTFRSSGGWGLYWPIFFIMLILMIMDRSRTPNDLLKIFNIYAILTLTIIIFGGTDFSANYAFGSFNRIVFHFTFLGLASYYLYLLQMFNSSSRIKVGNKNGL
jgi:hypothetical protein